MLLMIWLNRTLSSTNLMRNLITLSSSSTFRMLVSLNGTFCVNISIFFTKLFNCYIGDSKRAMDEYTSEILMGGHNTLVIHNTCEDSLLASPIILDLVILTELCQRITFRGPNSTSYQPFHSVLSLLSYLCKVCLFLLSESFLNGNGD